jgi:hypothetical protein
VCDAAANVLKAYLEGNSRKNELYISRHLPFFQYLFGTEISMEAMYTELVRDNLKIVGCITAQVRPSPFSGSPQTPTARHAHHFCARFIFTVRHHRRTFGRRPPMRAHTALTEYHLVGTSHTFEI